MRSKKQLLKFRETTKYFVVAISAALLFASISTASAGGYYRHSPTIAKFVSETHGFKFLATALEVANLTDALNGHKHFTLFAPTDEAFQELANACKAVDGNVIDLALALDSVGLLDDVLLYHVAKYPRSLRSILKNGSVTPLGDGEPLKSGVDNGGAFVLGQFNAAPSNIVVEGIRVRNGIIYPINSVLLNADPTPLCDPK